MVLQSATDGALVTCNDDTAPGTVRISDGPDERPWPPIFSAQTQAPEEHLRKSFSQQNQKFKIKKDKLCFGAVFSVDADEHTPGLIGNDLGLLEGSQ